MSQLAPCAHGQTLLDAMERLLRAERRSGKPTDPKVLDAMLEEVSRCVVCPRAKGAEVRG